ncbi:hypothetical protein HK107_05135 [Parvularcula sp. ZS-1/3]|uniref:SMP-30/Gluconolactonase/LRE-like region domain-containing protein n=1 Tax=Parvularcula mediterranea TaxID=2732508 RepID=A0A7Y3RLF6_9PROT|nr:hypothetical protein [Parvularcula mediterranea]NNU15701.1 hypothetical protein [Parvularcula mediterranea]
MRWAGLFLGLAACAGADIGEPRFAASDCRTVELVDVETGKTVVGAEDLALSEDGVLWISAYDRLTDEPGDLYPLTPQRLRGGAMLRAEGTGLQFLPHGVDVSGHGVAVLVRQGEKTTLTQVYQTRRFTDEGRRPLWAQGSDFEVHCASNDMISVGGSGKGSKKYITVDSRGCNPSFWTRLRHPEDGYVEEFAFVGSQRVTDYDRSVILDGLRIANGIAAWADDIWVAEMRARRLINLDRETIDLPGAPDNLNASSEGIVAALQPSLWRFGLYRYGHTNRAPTRIVLVDPETEEIELLYDDPKGAQLSGATAAVLTDGGMMVASSVRGEHLLVCEPSP